jgi:hypothetical protein
MWVISRPYCHCFPNSYDKALRKVNTTTKGLSEEVYAHKQELRKALGDLGIPDVHEQLSGLTKHLEGNLIIFNPCKRRP